MNIHDACGFPFLKSNCLPLDGDMGMILIYKLKTFEVITANGHAPIASLYESDRRVTILLALRKHRRSFTNIFSPPET